jgi:hypothetical protein
MPMFKDKLQKVHFSALEMKMGKWLANGAYNYRALVGQI